MVADRGTPLKTALVIAVVALLAGVPLCHAAPVIGVVDDEKLAQARRDYPELADKVIPQIAADKALKIVVRKSGISWMAPVTQWTDVTGEIITRLKAMNIAPSPAVAPARPAASTSPPPPYRAPEPPKPEVLTAEQRTAARAALKELRKMEAAVKVGINYENYSERLVDVKADVEDHLRAVPTSSLRTEMLNALAAYEDANVLWRESVRNDYIRSYLVAVRPVLVKHKFQRLLEILVSPELRGDVKWGDDILNHPSKLYITDPLQSVWAIASRHNEQADALLR